MAAILKIFVSLILKLFIFQMFEAFELTNHQLYRCLHNYCETPTHASRQYINNEDSRHCIPNSIRFVFPS